MMMVTVIVIVVVAIIIPMMMVVVVSVIVIVMTCHTPIVAVMMAMTWFAIRMAMFPVTLKQKN